MQPWKIQLALVTVGALLAAANAFTTRRLWGSAAFERPQKVAQTVLMWLVPGTFVVVRHFLIEPHRERPGDPTIWPVEGYHVDHHGGGGGHHGGGGSGGGHDG